MEAFLQFVFLCVCVWAVLWAAIFIVLAIGSVVSPKRGQNDRRD